MKRMTHKQVIQHRARERMRALRGETVKPRGHDVFAWVGQELACHGCGYHVCSCARKAAAQSMGPMPTLTPWSAYNRCILCDRRECDCATFAPTPPRQGMSQILVTRQQAAASRKMIADMATYPDAREEWASVATFPPWASYSEQERAAWRRVQWMMEFGSVSLGDMRGMCAAWYHARCSAEEWPRD